jgi:hypothetical protein
MISQKMKRITIRTFIVIMYILLAVVMFATGRTHTILIDNKPAADGSYKAVNGMTVTINKLEPSEFMKGDRDKFLVKGQKVKIHVESFDGSIDTEYAVKIPFAQDSVLISIPKLAADIKPAVEKFDLN